MCTKMKKKQYKQYSEEVKLSVIRDYYSSGMSKYACQKKYRTLRKGRYFFFIPQR